MSQNRGASRCDEARGSGTDASAKHRAVVALVSGCRPDQAAREAGVSVATVYRWLKKPRFASELYRAQRMVVDRIARRVADEAAGMVDVLRELAHDTEAKCSTRLGAAKTFLEMTVKFRTLAIEESLQAQLQGLEDRLRAQELADKADG